MTLFLWKKDLTMKEFVEYIVKNLVDNPDQVRINEVGGTHTLIIEFPPFTALSVNPLFWWGNAETDQKMD